MKIFTATQMAELDRLSIKKHKIPARKLMQKAAEAVASEVVYRISYVGKIKIIKILILCGPGNNGGDGFAVAYLLNKEGIDSDVFFLGKPEKLSSEAKYFYDRLKVPPQPIQKESDLNRLKKSLKGAHIIVDALFGTGLNRKLTGLYKKVIEISNRSSGFKIAIDIPSGISGNTGEVLGVAINANSTVTFEYPKWGQLQPEAWDYVGKLIVRPIGLARSEAKKMKVKAEWIAPEEMEKLFRPRSFHTHKGTAGKVLVIAGSTSMPGAGYLASMAALRAGAGLVTWAFPTSSKLTLELLNPEVILHPMESNSGKFDSSHLKELQSLSKDFQAMVIGPGIGQGSGVLEFLESCLKKIRLPKVVDADALNLVAQKPTLLKLLRGAILTPHPKEMSRLMGKKVREILKHRVDLATGFAAKHQVWLILKGYRSVVAGPKKEIYLNSTGGPNLSTAGSGDVLSGVLASFLAHGMKTKDATRASVFLHGMAGDMLARQHGDRGTLASEIATELPIAIQKMTQSKS